MKKGDLSEKQTHNFCREDFDEWWHQYFRKAAEKACEACEAHEQFLSTIPINITVE
jgi:hypothetical protein